MATESDALERIYREYLVQLESVDFMSVAEKLGGRPDGDAIVLPFFGRPHRVSQPVFWTPRERGRAIR